MIDPDHHLRMLAKELAADIYQPRPMPLIPFPKGGRAEIKLRHFCQPSVKDQVAFAVFGVLLGPLLEAGMKPFSFGNRWFRRVYWEEGLNGQNGCWKHRAWSLADTEFYQPYRRAHGLFRRVASWTVDAMLHAPSVTMHHSDSPDVEEYEAATIPSFAKRDYWKSRRCERVHHVRLDLKLAFPSVKIDQLQKQAETLLDLVFNVPAVGAGIVKNIQAHFRKVAVESAFQEFEFMPKAVARDLLNRTMAGNLIKRLTKLLSMIRYVPFEDSDKLFFETAIADQPGHQLSLGNGAKHPGLPTGLCISPLLLNTYLSALGSKMNKWVEGKSGAFLRFADDMILLAKTPEALFEGIECIRAGLGIYDSRDSLPLNLYLNEDKIAPEELKPFLSGAPNSLLWNRNSEAFRSFKVAAMETAITAQNRDPFVTYLVEHMSEIGRQDAFAALPEQVNARLSHLHQIVMGEPREDAVPRSTQMAFAANQLSRSWLPEESAAGDAKALQAIRYSLECSLRSAPDKPKIWRSVLRAALRRPCASDSDKRDLKDAQGIAEKWWLSLAGRFASGADAKWLTGHHSDKFEKWPLFASCHCAVILHTMAATLRELATVVSQPDGFPSSQSWLFRAGDEKKLVKTRSWLESLLERTVELLFPNSADRKLHWWERRAITACRHALLTESTLSAHGTATLRLREEYDDAVDILFTKQRRKADTSFSSAETLESPGVGLAEIVYLSSPQSERWEKVGELLSGGKATNQRLVTLFATFELSHETVMQAAKREMDRLEPKLMKTNSEYDMWDYHRARKVYLELGGTLE
jgi:hypothetical protein